MADLAKQLADLEALKAAAVAAERYEEAGDLKNRIAEFKAAHQLKIGNDKEEECTKDPKLEKTAERIQPAAECEPEPESAARSDTIATASTGTTAELTQPAAECEPEPESAALRSDDGIATASTGTTGGRMDERAERLKTEGNALFKSKKYEDALSKYDEAIVIDPTSAVYYCNRSNCYAQLLKWDASKNDAEKAIGICPLYVKGWARLARAQLELFLTDEAGEAIAAGLKLDPADKSLQKLKLELEDLTTPLLGAAAEYRLFDG